jgi:hypothetical protein
MKNTIKTRTVQFSYGLVKDASLKVPVGSYCIHDIVVLIRESYLDWAFRPENNTLMSDEVLTSSIGQAHFVAGALGGYKPRISAETYWMVEESVKDDWSMAMAVARYRMPGATLGEIYLRASKNEVLDDYTRKNLAIMASPEVQAMLA